MKSSSVLSSSLGAPSVSIWSITPSTISLSSEIWVEGSPPEVSARLAIATFASSQIESASSMNASWSSWSVGAVCVSTGTIGASSSPPQATTAARAKCADEQGECHVPRPHGRGG